MNAPSRHPLAAVVSPDAAVLPRATGGARSRSRRRGAWRALALAGVALAPAGCSCANNTGWTAAYEITRLDQTIGGPKAMARPRENGHAGDIILENDRVRFAILGTRVSMGPHTSGASLLDADLQRSDPRYSQGKGLDQLAETFPTINLNVQQADAGTGEVTVLDAGGQGRAAHVCTIGPEQSFITLLDALWGLQWPGDRPYFHMRTDYILAPGDAAVLMRTSAIFADNPSCEDDFEAQVLPGEDDNLPIVQLALDNVEGGLVFGDFYLQGGSVDVFTPDVGFDEGTFVQNLLAEGVNTFDEPIRVPFLAGNADRVSYALAPDEGSLFVPMFTSSQTVAVGAGIQGDGTSTRFSTGDGPFTYDRWFGVGRGDVGSAIEAIWEARGDELGSITGHVVEHSTAAPLSHVRVIVYRAGEEAPFIEWTTDVGDDPQLDGSFGGKLPPGNYELMLHKEGRPDSARVKATVRAGQTIETVLEAGQPGGVRFQVVDEQGMRVPSKVTFVAVGNTESPRDPVLGDGFIGGNPAQVVFTADGAGEVVLPPGQYKAIASRGIEYEIDESNVITVSRDRWTDIDLQVVRGVDTTGWISADFHVHAARSHDSGVSLPDRAITMAAEGVEFFASTDHDAITDYAPAIANLDLEPWLTSSVGLEVTTIELGHFLGFPLVNDHLADNGGALDWTGLTPQEMIDGLRNLGDPKGEEPVVFVGHPRDGILGYFDQFGVNTHAEDDGELIVEGNALAAFSGNALLDVDNFVIDTVDAMEVLNAKRFEMIRTPTESEMALAADEDIDILDIIERDSGEQVALLDGTERLTGEWNGVLDDWFTLNNMGIRVTALGNSDTHSKTSIEAGCPRNFVQADTDDPAFLDEQAIARAVKEGRVVASFGPFVRFYVGDERDGPGADVSVDGEVEFTIEVSSPSWFEVNRAELYENGELVMEWGPDDMTHDGAMDLATTWSTTPSKDSWYVLVAMGDTDMAPVFTPVEFPPIQLEDVVYGALANLPIGALLGDAVALPRAFPVYPYAVTNPIWIDSDSDGEWTPPGVPAWVE